MLASGWRRGTRSVHQCSFELDRNESVVMTPDGPQEDVGRGGILLRGFTGRDPLDFEHSWRVSLGSTAGVGREEAQGGTCQEGRQRKSGIG